MAQFEINVPIETDNGTIEVTITSQKPLRLGRHRFQLVVVDDSGNQSAPDVVEVRVVDKERPTAVLTGPSEVNHSASFNLSGADSRDVGGGTIKKFIWTYIGPAIPIIPIIPVVPITPVGPVGPG